MGSIILSLKAAPLKAEGVRGMMAQRDRGERRLHKACDFGEEQDGRPKSSAVSRKIQVSRSA